MWDIPDKVTVVGSGFHQTCVIGSGCLVGGSGEHEHEKGPGGNSDK
jgi:hypothetical protein